MPLKKLIIDLDCYFASVEQQLTPSLRGKPLGVVPVVSDSTCCIAVSREAKRFGVKTGTGVMEARQLCPEIVLVESRPAEYVKIHHEFLLAVEASLPIREAMSIDEVVCDLDSNSQTRESVEKLAAQIKKTMACRIGRHITCSLGAAPNHFLAKLASDMDKPNGLCILEKKDLPHRLNPLKLRDLCGVGKSMEDRLRKHGICSMQQLTSAPKSLLHAVWGSIGGIHMWYWLRGEETVPPPTRKRVLGHSHVLPTALRTAVGARAVTHRLLQKAAMRLRKLNYHAAGLHLSIKSSDHQRWSHDIVFAETCDTMLMLRALQKLWELCPPSVSYGPKKVGVTLFHLKPSELVTADMFSWHPYREKLCAYMDGINKRYGLNKVTFGGAMGALDYAPMRIAFTRIPDQEMEHAGSTDNGKGSSR